MHFQPQYLLNYSLINLLHYKELWKDKLQSGHFHPVCIIGAVCSVPDSFASLQAAEASLPLLLAFFPRVGHESKAGKGLGEKSLPLPGCSRAAQQLPLQPVV